MAKFKMATLSKIQFRGLLQNGRLTQLCPNQCLHMNWVPILPQTEEDIEFAVRKKATVRLIKFVAKLIKKLAFCRCVNIHTKVSQ